MLSLLSHLSSSVQVFLSQILPLSLYLLPSLCFPSLLFPVFPFLLSSLSSLVQVFLSQILPFSIYLLLPLSFSPSLSASTSVSLLPISSLPFSASSHTLSFLFHLSSKVQVFLSQILPFSIYLLLPLSISLSLCFYLFLTFTPSLPFSTSSHTLSLLSHLSSSVQVFLSQILPFSIYLLLPLSISPSLFLTFTHLLSPFLHFLPYAKSPFSPFLLG
jgi:hypothetical protein